MATGFEVGVVVVFVDVGDACVLDFRLPRAANGSNPAPNIETPPIGFLGFVTGASSRSFSSSSSSTTSSSSLGFGLSTLLAFNGAKENKTYY